MVAAGHYLASQAGFAILEAGGNAFDAGVAAGLVLGVVQSDIVNVAGVAPILVHVAKTRETLEISGLGTWPAALRAGLFQEEHQGHIPKGLLRTVVPAAPDAWIQVLTRWGTMTFGDVATAAIRFARDGFAMHALMAELIWMQREDYARWPSSAAIYLPSGRPPRVGELFVQRDLAASLQYMVDQERSASACGRAAGLQAAHDAFYRGDIARRIVDYHERYGGLLTMHDMASFSSGIEPPPSVRFGSARVFGCGPWCQGPTILQMLKMAEVADVAKLRHNSAEYVHMLTEIMKLAFADRDAHVADPRFHPVPLERLLCKAYAQERLARIDPRKSYPQMPEAGMSGPASHPGASAGAPGPALDTSYVCVVDRHGNVFSATPSDVSSDTPVIPGTGLCPSSRGSQSWADPAHAASALPGKRPRLTPNPALALFDDGRAMPFGTPGGDVQAQAMLQVFLNRVAFGMAPQAAVEAPRFATYSFPDSFEPHAYFPNRVHMETRILPEVFDGMRSLGHDVVPWGDWTWRAGAVCLIDYDPATGFMQAGADPRRPGYASGW